MSECSRKTDDPGAVRAKGGFVLLEALVAFTILAAVLSSLLAAVFVASRHDQQSAFMSAATMLGQSKLAAAGIDYPIRVGRSSGRSESGYVWQADVVSYRTVEGTLSSVARTYWITVTVADPRSGRSLAFSSIELTPSGQR
jgi:Tfp pilus assembly protein PilV